MHYAHFVKDAEEDRAGEARRHAATESLVKA